MFGCVNLLRYVQVRFGVVLACLEYMIANRGLGFVLLRGFLGMAIYIKGVVVQKFPGH